jgi:hypothetical protein
VRFRHSCVGSVRSTHAHIIRLTCQPLARYRSKQNTLRIYDINIHNQVLKSTNSAKYLGVTITNDLTWNHHINNITNKANASVGSVRSTHAHIIRLTCAFYPRTFCQLNLCVLRKYLLLVQLVRFWCLYLLLDQPVRSLCDYH